MNILTINAGSSSIKVKVFRLHNKNKVTSMLSDQLTSLEQFHKNSKLSQISVDCVINRITYGGEEYRDITLLHSRVIEVLSKYTGSFAEEQAYNLLAAQHFINMYPKINHYATFDTGFHTTIPKTNYDYSYSFEKNYGYHGLSYSYIARRLNSLVESKIAKGKWIIAHLGTKGSICGIKNGKSMVNICLWHDTSGLLKLSAGISNEMEILLSSKAELASFAIDSYATSVASSISRVATPLGGIDGIIFTGGIGEKSPLIRALVVEKLKWLDINLNKKANNNQKLKISKKDCRIKMLVVPTNEGLDMVNQLIEQKL